MSSTLFDVALDPDLSQGAYNAVNVCLKVRPEEKVTLITDAASGSIAASLAHELEGVGAPYHLWELEELAPRPLQSAPPEILQDLETSQVSIFAICAQPHELPSRRQITEVAVRRKIRHAHMVNITKQIMMEGMRADFRKVDAISRRVLEIVSAAEPIRVKSAAGTDLVAQFNPGYRWLKTSGIISPETWSNLPGGEVFTAPERVDGTFVVDGVVGDYLCARFGDLRNQPLTIRVRENRLVEAHSENRELEQEFWAYTHSDANSDRVGEFAIGTNVGVRGVIGNILQDEKIPGVHIAFGDPLGAYTGATWNCSTHIDVVGTRFDIFVGERQLMRGGNFLLDS
ncbi:MAG: aminopeptidase [Terriglobia bacterium]|jgi:leucyl aminopeptidase (aminopeptidase T)